jgi:hypothetical protein
LNTVAVIKLFLRSAKNISSPVLGSINLLRFTPTFALAAMKETPSSRSRKKTDAHLQDVASFSTTFFGSRNGSLLSLEGLARQALQAQKRQWATAVAPPRFVLDMRGGSSCRLGLAGHSSTHRSSL